MTMQKVAKVVINVPKKSPDGDPDGLTPTLRFDNLLFQAVEPDARVEHFSHLTVFTYEDTAFGIF